MNVLAVWLRLDLRRRWRSLLVLVLLVAFASGTVLAAVAGAIRGNTAVDRMLSVSLPADAVVLPNQPGFDWAKVRALPQVDTVSTFVVGGFYLAEAPGDDQAVAFPPADANVMSTLERPVVLEGRLADQSRVDEAVVTPEFVNSRGLGVGDTVHYVLPTAEEMDAYYSGVDDSLEPTGPRIAVRIVGVVRSGWFGDAVGDQGGSLIPTAAVFEHYRANLLGASESVYINALVRLHDGEAALPEFKQALAEATGRSDIDVWNMAELERHAQKVNAFEAACLLAFGVAALIAALFLVGQAIARYAAATIADLQVLRGLGLTPRLAVVIAVAAPTLAAALGGTLGVAAAIVASRWFPIGAAATIEPAPGVSADWLVLAPGWVAVPLTVAVGAGLAARFALASTRHEQSSRRSTVALAAARVGLPVPVVVGARFALEPGRGRSAVPVRPAILGAVVGVLGILAAFTFSAGVADAADNRDRFGQTYQLETFVGYNGEDATPVEPALAAIADNADVAGANDSVVNVAESGGRSVTIYTYRPVGAPVDVVLTAGHLPVSADDVVLAPDTAQALQAQVGSSVHLTGNHGSAPMTVSGIAFVPEGSHNSYADGAWMTAEGYARLFTGFKFHLVQVALRLGADPESSAARLQEATAETGGLALPFAPPPTPTQVAEIEDVRILPIALGGFLVVLAVGAVGHALATAVRRRRHDMAVLRALGMTRWQSRGVVTTQATLLGAIGLVFGLPLGLALGRTLWRVVADYTPVFYAPPVAFWALVLVGPVTLLVANALAAWPGQRAARMRIGHVLRAE